MFSVLLRQRMEPKTWAPCARAYSAMWLPTNPVMPVIKSLHFPRFIRLRAGGPRGRKTRRLAVEVRDLVRAYGRAEKSPLHPLAPRPRPCALGAPDRGGGARRPRPAPGASSGGTSRPVTSGSTASTWPGTAGGQHRQPARHGLEHRERQALAARRGDVEVDERQHARRVRDRAREHDAVPRRRASAASARSAARSGPSPTIRSCASGTRATRSGMRAQEHVETLDRVEAGDGARARARRA